MTNLSAAARIVGAILIAISLWLSFSHLAPAGFFLFVGILTVTASFVSGENLKSFNVSATSVSAEFHAQIDRAEILLQDIKKVETRLSLVLSEVLLNKGGEHYMGGMGEEAEFNIYRSLIDAADYSKDEHLTANLQELKHKLGLKLLWAVAGQISDRETAPTLINLLQHNSHLPNADELVLALQQDGIEIGEGMSILSDYDQFVQNGKLPTDGTVSSIYRLKTRRLQFLPRSTVTPEV
jgi:hypothetical protein